MQQEHPLAAYSDSKNEVNKIRKYLQFLKRSATEVEFAQLSEEDLVDIR